MTNLWLPCLRLATVRSVQLHVFPAPDQLPDESVTAYTAALWMLAADCNCRTADPTTRLYNSTMLHDIDVMIWEKLVCGLRKAHIQQRLFTEQHLSFKTAYGTALCAEGVVKH